MPKAWQHQVEAVEFARGKPGAMLAHEMGTGKTKTAIDVMDANGYSKVLILAPLLVVGGVWPGEFQKHSNRGWSVIALNKGTTAQRMATAQQALSSTDPTAIVINYEAAYGSGFQAWALAQDWDLIVFDESHRIKAAGGVASRWCSRMSDKVSHRPH